jgi:hypothetical protein
MTLKQAFERFNQVDRDLDEALERFAKPGGHP